MKEKSGSGTKRSVADHVGQIVAGAGDAVLWEKVAGGEGDGWRVEKSREKREDTDRRRGREEGSGAVEKDHGCGT